MNKSRSTSELNRLVSQIVKVEDVQSQPDNKQTLISQYIKQEEANLPNLPSQQVQQVVEVKPKPPSNNYFNFLNHVQSYIKFLATSKSVEDESEDKLLDRFTSDLKSNQIERQKLNQTLQKTDDSLSFDQKDQSQQKISQDEQNDNQVVKNVTFQDSKPLSDSFEDRSSKQTTREESLKLLFPDQANKQLPLYQSQGSVSTLCQKIDDNKRCASPISLSDDEDQDDASMAQSSEDNGCDKDIQDDISMLEEKMDQTQTQTQKSTKKYKTYDWSDPAFEFLLQAIKAVKKTQPKPLYEYMNQPETKRPEGVESVPSLMTIKNKLASIQRTGIDREFKSNIECQIYCKLMMLKDAQQKGNTQKQATKQAQKTKKVIKKKK